MPTASHFSWAAIHQTKPPRVRPRHLEDDFQRQVIETVRYSMRYNDRPLTDWLYAVPNGGKRDAREAARLKAQGVKAGVNDLVLPIMAGGFGGLYVELKVGKNTLSDLQLDFHQRAREGGQCVVTCWTLQHVIQVISGYMLKAPGKFEHRNASSIELTITAQSGDEPVSMTTTISGA